MRSNGHSFRSERGFTLIELLTTVAIIGILSAIVTNHFRAYTARALTSRAESDIRAAVTAEEAFYAENEEYTSCSGVACNTALPSFKLSLDVQLEIVARDDNQYFDAESFHPRGDKEISFSSETGVFSSVDR